MIRHPRPPDWEEELNKRRGRGESMYGFVFNEGTFEAGADAIYQFAFEQGRAVGKEEVWSYLESCV